MTVGEKLRIARNLRGYTQKHLGDMTQLSDVRIRQYELGIRTPKEGQLRTIATALNVPMEFFNPCDLDGDVNVMHLLFDLEALKVLSVQLVGGQYVIAFQDAGLNKCLEAWHEKRALFHRGELCEEEYALWKAMFPLCVENPSE